MQLPINQIIHGDCLEVMKTFPDKSIDSVITDPPYELGFMGKSWDNTGIANDKNVWAECLRVLKPGGHLLSFGGTRTYHRMAVAIEDAGFEVRDMIEWIYGSGFPKSLNIGKAVDKLQGNEREWVSETKGTSKYEGWGTALKPAHEPICMARKPIAEKTVAENCLKWGTGGINIDGSRVVTDIVKTTAHKTLGDGIKYGKSKPFMESEERIGRFPANLIHDNSEEVIECFPDSNSGKGKASTYEKFGGQFGKGKQIRNEDYGDSGSASRFFKSIIYQAKASKSERNKGLEDFPDQLTDDGREKSIDNAFQRGETPRKNNHPTVKPIALMEYLIKMVTPKGGIVLDPFAGSGSTAVACINTGYNYVCIEKEEEYIKICNARISNINKALF